MKSWEDGSQGDDGPLQLPGTMLWWWGQVTHVLASWGAAKLAVHVDDDDDDDDVDDEFRRVSERPATKFAVPVPLRRLAP